MPATDVGVRTHTNAHPFVVIDRYQETDGTWLRGMSGANGMLLSLPTVLSEGAALSDLVPGRVTIPCLQTRKEPGAAPSWVYGSLSHLQIAAETHYEPATRHFKHLRFYCLVWGGAK